MERKIFFIVCVIALIANALGSGSCPTASRLDSCSPKCKDNSNCHGAQICCTNICGTKSCVDQYQYLSDSKNKGSKTSSSRGGGSGTYCGNVKCQAYEKCELDRSTKREKCVRG